MASSSKIPPQLLQKLVNKSGLAPSSLYRRVSLLAAAGSLPPRLAAIRLAQDYQIAVSSYASDSDLAALRGVSTTIAAPNTVIVPKTGDATFAHPTKPRAKAKGKPKAKGKTDAAKRKIFVVYGRDEPLRKAMFEFLRSLGLRPMEWNDVLSLSKAATPHVFDALDKALNSGAAILVMFNPEEQVKLLKRFVRPGDSKEDTAGQQPRPNVLLEAGMAFARQPDRTIVVQIGKTRGVSDLAGLHILHFSGDSGSRHSLVTRLRRAKCPVETTGDDWLTTGKFA